MQIFIVFFSHSSFGRLNVCLYLCSKMNMTDYKSSRTEEFDARKYALVDLHLHLKDQGSPDP